MISKATGLGYAIADGASSIDETRLLAERGWPTDRALDLGDLDDSDEAEVREAIQERAKAIVARVDEDAAL